MTNKILATIRISNNPYPNAASVCNSQDHRITKARDCIAGVVGNVLGPMLMAQDIDSFITASQTKLGEYQCDVCPFFLQIFRNFSQF